MTVIILGVDMEFTDKVEIARLMDSAKAYVEANAIKEQARAHGYVHTLSLYGVITNKDDGHSEYRRIEIYSNVFWTGQIIELIYRFFQAFYPDKCYTIWLYDKDKHALRNIGRWD